MSNERENNYDLLRIISAFAIVMLHVSAGFIKYDDIKSPINCNLPVMVLNSLTRFAVPCFFMLSGAFILADDKNEDYKYFYKSLLMGLASPALSFVSFMSFMIYLNFI